MKKFKGKVLFLDRSDINTDEIIPAKYLTELSKAALKPHILEDLKLEDFNPLTDIEGKGIIISRSNFGCGSSREHAPWVFEINDINVIIASGFARIFRQNCYNCGMMAIELPVDDIELLFNTFNGSEADLSVDIKTEKIIISNKENSEEINFALGDFDKALVKSGGWVDYADLNY
ncbi:MAG: 3-isopropylmalate dehydratase small subunit [bacterium]|nr:3-isopropylmalate dehydratase small subunit [bacterium]